MEEKEIRKKLEDFKKERHASELCCLFCLFEIG